MIMIHGEILETEITSIIPISCDTIEISRIDQYFFYWIVYMSHLNILYCWLVWFIVVLILQSFYICKVYFKIFEAYIFEFVIKN